MNKFEATLLKWNFKKITISYLIITLVIAIGCAGATGIIFRDRINFSLQYSHVYHAIKANNHTNLEAKLKKLADSSSDVVDILMLDANDHVTYSANQSKLNCDTFTLIPSTEESGYLVWPQNNRVVFRYVSGDRFMLISLLNSDFERICFENDSDDFYQSGISNKTVYMLNCIRGKNASDKVYIISSPTLVAGGKEILKLDACLAMLLFMAYWVLTALWVFQNALRAKLSPLFWGVIVLFTNLAGVFVYLLYKRGNVSCPHCKASQSRNHVYCVFCGKKLTKTCQNCSAPIHPSDGYCPHCGAKNTAL